MEPTRHQPRAANTRVVRQYSNSTCERWKSVDDQSKKHHYVPRSVLRRFSFDQARTWIYVFDKAQMKSFPSSILNAGCENHFNAVEVEGQTVSFEGLFQTNDNQLARLLDTIVSNRSLVHLTPEDRVALSEVVAAQIVRTKMMRTTMRSIAEQMLAALCEVGIDPGEVDGLSIPTDQEVKRAALASFLDLRRIVGALQEKRPILIHSSNSQVFWISDNPVVLHNTFPYGERALNAPGIEIYFPISSELVLGFFCPSIEVKIQQLLSLEHPGIDRQKYSEIYRGLQGGDAVSLGPETVPFLNSLQVLHSSRFLYAPSNEFEHAREILQRQPKAQNVQTLFSVGRMGQGPPSRLNMPPGLWVVFYGGRNHHMIAVDGWDESADCLEFETRDLVTLQAILDDQPLKQAVLFQDGAERRGMREVEIEVLRKSAPFHIRVTHRDEILNQLLRSVRVRRLS
jgi:hypothetical protein